MARPERHDVDYFPFFAKRGKTLNILQSKYGLEGIGFFTNLLRFLALTPDHYYCIQGEDDRLNFFAEIGMQEEKKGIEMIEIMAKTGKLDKKLWEDHKVIACEAFLESLEEAYKRRANEIITMDEIREIFENGGEKPVFGDLTEIEEGGEGGENQVNVDINPVNVDNNPAVCELLSKFEDNNPQSKVKKSKVKKSKYSGDSEESQKLKKPPLREREPENDYERVEKAYLQNWASLYSRGKVKTQEPVVNWNQTRFLLKRHFEKLKPDLIIQGVKNGMKDDFVLSSGYSLGVILSASVLNRLINAENKKQGQRIANDNVADEDIDKYFREA
jgi:hypothetical protein